MNYEEYVERFNRRADVFSLDIDKDIDMRKSLIEQEDELWNEWAMTYSPEELKQFCFDGLLAGRNKDPKEEEKKWLIQIVQKSEFTKSHIPQRGKK